MTASGKRSPRAAAQARWKSLSFSERETWLLAALMLSRIRRPQPPLAAALPKDRTEDVVADVAMTNDLDLTPDGALLIGRLKRLLGL